MNILKIKIINASLTFTGHSDGDIIDAYINPAYENNEYDFKYLEVGTGKGFQESFEKEGVIEVLK